MLSRTAAKVSVIIEVGGGRGEGSTSCLVHGLPRDGQLYTVEVDSNHAKALCTEVRNR